MGLRGKRGERERRGYRGSESDGPVSEKGVVSGVYGPAEILLDHRIEKKMS